MKTDIHAEFHLALMIWMLNTERNSNNPVHSSSGIQKRQLESDDVRHQVRSVWKNVQLVVCWIY